MALKISINRVYQKVLAIANKEQRGYITPQEFNLFADQAQMEIFEQYFYDLDQVRRGQEPQSPYNNTQEFIHEKIARFERYDKHVSASGNWGNVLLYSFFPNLYKLNQVRVRYQSKNDEHLHYATRFETGTDNVGSPLVSTSWRYGPRWKLIGPRYQIMANGDHDLYFKLYPYPKEGDTIVITYTEKPITPNWGYRVSNKNALYDPSSTVDFELHPSEENNLVFKILQMAGVSMKAQDIAQAAAGKELIETQQQKQ